MKSILIFVLFINSINAQKAFQLIDNVPSEFVKKYYKRSHNYNPLQLGNHWQYFSDTGYLNEYIVKDTIVNNKRYFKKFDFRDDFRKEGYFFNWERNDTLKRSTYMLDREDLDNDGQINDELLLDSLEVPYWTEYISYRQTWKKFIFNESTRALVTDSSWAIVFGDTVMTRYIQYRDHFHEELVADKYGVVVIKEELAEPNIISGALIDSILYGNIVSSLDKDLYEKNPSKIELFQNYPNPYNSKTKIKYKLIRKSRIKLSIFDITGEKITDLINDIQPANIYEISFNSEQYNMASGIYIYKIEVGTFSLAKKLIYIK